MAGIIKLTRDGASTLRRVLDRGRTAPTIGKPLPHLSIHPPIRVFRALQDWAANATFPARLQRWDGSAWLTALENSDIQITDFQGFSGKQNAMGFTINLYGRWWHISSTCPT